MRLSELSQETETSVATIKFYLRDGLLPPGDATGPRRADYSQLHVRRLRLIRTLTEVGRLRLRDVRAVLDAIDEPGRTLHDVLGVAHRALGPPPSAESDPDVAAARMDVDAFLASMGWRVSADAPARTELAQALATLRRSDGDADARVFAPYARVADRLAAREIGAISRRTDRTQTVEDAVVGTVVFELALVALRRLAHEHHSARRFRSRR